MRIGLPPLKLLVDLDGVLGLGPEDGDLDSKMTAAVTTATLLGAEFLRGVWLQVAGAMDIRGGFGGSGLSYLQGIENASPEIEQVQLGQSQLSVTVAVVNRAPHASIVEDGHAAFSLVDKINWGATGGRIKRGPNGPYLQIPFRHAAYASEGQMQRQGYTMAARKAMMPPDVTRAARALTATIRQGAGPIFRQRYQAGGGMGIGGAPAFLQADRYTWGQRLRRDVQAGIAIGPSSSRGPGFGVLEKRSAHQVGRGLVNPAWQTSKYEGLFRVAQSGGGSHFMTIRTITPHSQGWKIPAQMGRHVAARVASVLQSGAAADQLLQIVWQPFLAALGVTLDGQ